MHNDSIVEVGLKHPIVGPRYEHILSGVVKILLREYHNFCAVCNVDSQSIVLFEVYFFFNFILFYLYILYYCFVLFCLFVCLFFSSGGVGVWGGVCAFYYFVSYFVLFIVCFLACMFCLFVCLFVTVCLFVCLFVCFVPCLHILFHGCCDILRKPRKITQHYVFYLGLRTHVIMFEASVVCCN